MRRLAFLLFGLLAFPATAAQAQQKIVVVAACSAQSLTVGAGAVQYMDTTGNLCTSSAGGSGGGTSSNFGAAFPATGTAAGFEYLLVPPTLTNGQMVAGQTDINGNLKVDVVAGSAGNASIGATGAAVPGSITYLGANNGGNAIGLAGTAAAELKTDVTTCDACNANGQATSANSIPVVLASDQSAVSVTVNPSSSASSGITPIVSASAEASHVIKASAGVAYSVYATNLTGTAGFLVVLNATSAPADGAITPLACAALAPNGIASINYAPGPPGVYSTGITAVVTSATTCFTKTTGVITAFLSGSVK